MTPAAQRAPCMAPLVQCTCAYAYGPFPRAVAARLLMGLAFQIDLSLLDMTVAAALILEDGTLGIMDVTDQLARHRL